MSLCKIGLNEKAEAEEICITILESEPLVRLANLIPWEQAAQVIEVDLKCSTRMGSVHLGPKLFLRVHLGAYFLQTLLNLTNRDLEYQLHFNALYQSFCQLNKEGRRFPDANSIEEFRSRICPETHRQLGLLVLKKAYEVGFLNPTWMDIDSTVQEANMSYPADANLMVKLAAKAYKLVGTFEFPTEQQPKVDIAEIKAAQKLYLIESRGAKKNVRIEIFSHLHATVCKYVVPVIEKILQLPAHVFEAGSRRFNGLCEQVCEKGGPYLADVENYIRTGTMAKEKLLCFHLEQVKCLPKGKVGKRYEFGRVFQLGRLGGNFLLVGRANSVVNSDRSAVSHMVAEHERLFGKGVLGSCGADRGYESPQINQCLDDHNVEKNGIQARKGTSETLTSEELTAHRNRRAGIEPLIGHLKNEFGMKKSRMKSDRTTLAAAYRSVTGFNLKNIIRFLVRQNNGEIDLHVAQAL